MSFQIIIQNEDQLQYWVETAMTWYEYPWGIWFETLYLLYINKHGFISLFIWLFEIESGSYSFSFCFHGALTTPIDISLPKCSMYLKMINVQKERTCLI